MKRVLFWIAMILTFTGCTNNIVSDVDIETINVRVRASDWLYTDYTENGMPYANNYFYAYVDVPEITRSVFDNGEVQAYIVYDRKSSLASKHILPYVRHYEEVDEYGDWHYYTETIDCMYGIGWVEFNYRASDFMYEDDVTIIPNDMDFTIVITKGY